MPSIYDINFAKFALRMLPPDKRFSKNIAYVKALLSPMQWVRDLWLGEYRTGTTAPAYVDGTAGGYNKYDRVVYNKVVYESLIDSNTSLPTDKTAWFIVQANFIGLSERMMYNGHTLTLTYAMNKWFGTTFRQPPSVSDIYIENNEVPIALFRSAATESNSSKVSTLTSSEFIANADYDATPFKNFTIKVPVAVYNALDTDMINNENIFRSFVNKYVAAGILYKIETY